MKLTYAIKRLDILSNLKKSDLKLMFNTGIPLTCYTAKNIFNKYLHEALKYDQLRVVNYDRYI